MSKLSSVQTAAITPETMTAVKTNVRRFYWNYAYRYALRALRSRGSKGTADRPEGGLNAAGNAPSDIVTLPNGRKLRVSACSTEAEETAMELAQDAALRWHKAKRGRKGKPPRRITTKQAIRDAVREYRQASRQRSAIRRCQSCRYQKKRCEECENKILDQNVCYARMTTKNGMTGQLESSLNAVVAATDIDLIISDYFPKTKSKKIKAHIEMLIRWLASGSTQKEIAEHLGVTDRYVRKLLTMLRESLDADHFRNLAQGYLARSERTYGDKPGSALSDGIGAILDGFDAIYGHASPAMRQPVPTREYLCRIVRSNPRSKAPPFLSYEWHEVTDYKEYPIVNTFVGPMQPEPTTQPDATHYPALPVEPDATFGPEFSAAYAEVFYGPDDLRFYAD